MSKTLNSKLSYLIYHLKPSSDIFTKKSKHKIDLDDVPHNLKNKVTILDKKCALARYGNQRKDIAKAKVFKRKRIRHKNESLLKKEINDI